MKITAKDLSSIERSKAIISNLTMVPTIGDIYRYLFFWFSVLSHRERARERVLGELWNDLFSDSCFSGTVRSNLLHLMEFLLR